MNAGFARRVGNSNLIKNDEKGCLFFPAGMASSWQDFGEEGFLFCLFISRSLRPKKQKCRSVVSLEKWLVLYQCMYGFFSTHVPFLRNCILYHIQKLRDYNPDYRNHQAALKICRLHYNELPLPSYFTTTETAFSKLIEL